MTQRLAEHVLEGKREKVRTLSNGRIQGVPLFQFNDDGGIDLTPPLPIQWCFCVQDSPQNPCRCQGPIVWLPDLPKSARKTEHRSQKDLAVYDFELEGEANVFLELQARIPLRSLEQLTAIAHRRHNGQAARTSRPYNGEDGTAGVVYKKKKSLLGLAYAGGYAMGTLLDDLFGSNEGGNDNLSEDIGDWLADVLPDPPDWLRDLVEG